MSAKVETLSEVCADFSKIMTNYFAHKTEGFVLEKTNTSYSTTLVGLGAVAGSAANWLWQAKSGGGKFPRGETLLRGAALGGFAGWALLQWIQKNQYIHEARENENTAAQKELKQFKQFAETPEQLALIFETFQAEITKVEQRTRGVANTERAVLTQLVAIFQREPGKQKIVQEAINKYVRARTASTRE